MRLSGSFFFAPGVAAAAAGALPYCAADCPTLLGRSTSRVSPPLDPTLPELWGALQVGQLFK